MTVDPTFIKGTQMMNKVMKNKLKFLLFTNDKDKNKVIAGVNNMIDSFNTIQINTPL